MKIIKINVIHGTWKFKPKVSLGELAAFTSTLASDKLYEKLYLRKTSKNPDAYGISFVYNSNHPDKYDKEVFDEYIDKTLHKMRRIFGNNIIGWDISSSMFIIK